MTNGVRSEVSMPSNPHLPNFINGYRLVDGTVLPVSDVIYLRGTIQKRMFLLVNLRLYFRGYGIIETLTRLLLDNDRQLVRRPVASSLLDHCRSYASVSI